MKKMIIGTRNVSKVEQMQGVLSPLWLEIVGLPEGMDLDVVESGDTLEENARLKATVYARELGGLVFSTDQGLYLENLPESLQPGINVRNISGRTDRATDEEMITYYSSLVDEYGENGELAGKFVYAVCIADQDSIIAETVIERPTVLVSTPSLQKMDGYPLESLQFNQEMSKYVSEMTWEERTDFWRNGIGKDIAIFVREVLGL